MSHPSRRYLLGAAFALGALAATPSVAQFSPSPAAPLRFSSVSVDVSRLQALGLGPFADLLAAATLAEARRTFADRLGGPGPRLVIRLTGLSLNSYAGGESFRGRGGGVSSDYLEGEALVVGPGGQILARYPQLSAVPASSGGAWYTPGNEERRAVYIARHFAAWLRRTVGA